MALPKYAPTKVQSSSTYSSSTSDTLQDAYHSNLGTGNLLVAVCFWHSGGTQTCTVASSNNGSWSAIGSPQVGTGNLAGWSLQLFYKMNSTSGADTVTMTCSGTNDYRGLAIHEFNQVDTASALEASVYSGNVTASSDIITSGNITTANKLDLLFAACLVDNDCSAVGPRFSEGEYYSGNRTEYAVRFDTGTYAATFSTSGTTDASIILVAFKQTAAVLGTPNNYVFRIPFNGGLRVVTAAENTEFDGRFQEIVELDSLVHNPNKVCYFEAVAKTSASMTNNIRLFCDVVSGPDLGLTYDITGIEIPAGTTSYTLFRSQAFYLPHGDKIDFCPKISAAPGGTTSLCAWRVILIEGSGENAVHSAELQIEIGNTETKTNNSIEPLNNPKYYKYDSSHWDGSIRYWCEYMIFGDGGDVTLWIQEDDGNFDNWTNWFNLLNNVTISSYTFNIPQITSTVNSGRHYRLAGYVSAGHSYTVYNCKFLVVTYEGASTFESGSYDQAYDVLGGTAGSGETNQAKAQYFPITKTHHVTGVTLSLKKTGSPADNVVVDLVSSLGGASLAHGTLDASTLTTSWQEKTITFDSAYDLSSGNYYIQITRSGARDASNYISAEGQNNFDDNLGQAYNRDNNSWATINYDIMYRLVSDVGINKIEIVDTLLNTGDGGTGLQNMPIQYDESFWSGAVHSLRYAHDSNNGSNASKLVALPSTDITNANVTGNNEQISADTFSWPATGTKIDVNVTDSTGVVAHGKIIDFVTFGEEEGECTVEVVTQVITQVTTNTVIGMY